VDAADWRRFHESYSGGEAVLVVGSPNVEYGMQREATKPHLGRRGKVVEFSEEGVSANPESPFCDLIVELEATLERPVEREVFFRRELAKEGEA